MYAWLASRKSNNSEAMWVAIIKSIYITKIYKIQITSSVLIYLFGVYQANHQILLTDLRITLMTNAVCGMLRRDE